MTHANHDHRNEKFRTRLIGDDESNYVETDFTIGELEETLANITNSAIFQEDPVALKILSLFAFTTKQFEDTLKEHSIMQARFEAFREAIEEIQNLPDSEIKEAISDLLEKDDTVGAIFEALGEIM